MNATLGLIFSATSALAAAVSASVALATLRDRLSDGDQRGRRGREGRRGAGPGRIVALALVSVLSAAGCVALLLYVFEEETVGDAPFLRAVIPPAVNDTCTPVAPPPDAIASVACRPSHQITAARYTLFKGSRAMREAFTDATRELGLPSGDCATQGFAVGSYGREGEGNWGRLACHADDSGTYIRWTNEDLRILAAATGRPGSDTALYRWWEDDGGPLPTSNLKTFPNPREKALIEWIPASHSKHCDRSSWGGTSALASIVCDPLGLDALGYASYASVEAMRRAHAKRIGLRPRSSMPSCSTAGRRGDGTYSYDGERAGRIVCYRSDDGEAFYEWTLDRSHVAVYARRDDGDLGALYDWWWESELPKGFVEAFD